MCVLAFYYWFSLWFLRHNLSFVYLFPGLLHMLTPSVSRFKCLYSFLSNIHAFPYSVLIVARSSEMCWFGRSSACLSNQMFQWEANGIFRSSEEYIKVLEASRGKRKKLEEMGNKNKHRKTGKGKYKKRFVNRKRQASVFRVNICIVWIKNKVC